MARSRQDDRPTQPPARDSGPTPKPWSAFAFADYRILWIASIGGLMTMQMRMLATGVWLYEETGSGLQLGALGLVQLAVQLPAILFGGALADQLDRKKLIAAAQSFSLVFVGIVAYLDYTDALDPWHIYAVTAILGVSSVLGGPARSAITANIVPRSHLMGAVAWNQMTFQAGAVIAPLAFAVIIETLDTAATFAIAAAFAVPATFMPLMIRTSVAPPDAGESWRSIIVRIWQGAKYVLTHPILPGLYLLDIGVTVFSYYRQVLPLIVDRMFRSGPGAVGVFTAANSLGGIAGTFAVLFLANYRAKGMLVLYATLAYAALLLVFGFTPALGLAALAATALGTLTMAGLGATDAIGMTTRQTTVQLTTPDDMRGRAVSAHSVSAMTANNLGTFYIGFMSERIGAENTMLLGGLISIAVVIAVWWLIKGVRQYRYP